MAAVNTDATFQSVISRQSTTAQRLVITVLSGGPGGERAVSLESGKAVTEALRSLGHTVHVEDAGPFNLAGLARQVDCVFVALHGTFGEDGQVQEILERRGLRYTGSAPEACALAMNKALAKERLAATGLPTPRWDVARRDRLREALACWSLPVVVKPVKQGSSLQCTIVRTLEDLAPAIEPLIIEYGECLIEDYIPGRELTVGILGDRALPPIEIRTRREFYDYQAKYVDEDTEYLFDIDLPQELLDHVGQMSLEAHRALGCRDFSRVDWRVDDVRMKPYLLEVNVIPGLTGHSLVPKAAAHAGISMPELCGYLVGLAMKRDPT